MGKPFLSELDAMPGVYEWAEKAGIGGLEEFTRKAVGRPLYVVGSGGSFSAAVFASLLHQSAGSISKAVTPLEFAGHTAIERESSVLIISAGGNNSDALSAFRITQALDPENIGVLCASTGGKLAGMARRAGNAAVHEATPPTGRDGFLATNTLVSTMVWLLRSHRNTYPPRYAVPGFSNLGSESTICAEPFRNVSTVIVLYDYWGKAAVVDAESKLAEGGLANVQLADYRNFAHGRHNWIRKNGGTTGMLAFVTPQCRALAESTLGLVPSHVPSVSICSRFFGPAASIDLMVQGMRFVWLVGTLTGTDPGRPKVVDYGRKMRHIRIPGSSGMF